ncbi:MAG: HAD-IIB family hydrolase [Propionibacteriaceae bacterium]|jgi:HAD superfamily hydrolase (TIGR01484 family)|nr:HAD-IIB family hydrolase [Propionibacteriaceae bacterium]
MVPVLVAFDLDDTLAESKSALTAEMGEALADLLLVREVCIISGGRFTQFDTQVLRYLPERADLTRLHLMPTCGTRYLRNHGDGWLEVYAYDLSDDEKRRAIASLATCAHKLGLWETRAWGERIEDRGSQITFSALGQEAPVSAKKVWDPTGDKRARLRAAVAADLPDLEVAGGGSTSIDVTRKGIDKAYGMRQLALQTGYALHDMVFIGDRIVPGGNDYPVYELGVPTIPVTGPADTLRVIARLIKEAV